MILSKSQKRRCRRNRVQGYIDDGRFLNGELFNTKEGRVVHVNQLCKEALTNSYGENFTKILSIRTFLIVSIYAKVDTRFILFRDCLSDVMSSTKIDSSLHPLLGEIVECYEACFKAINSSLSSQMANDLFNRSERLIYNDDTLCDIITL